MEQKQINRDSKRTSILQAGMKVLREKGISNTSMNDIIRASELSKGGVYHYFPSKNTFLIELWNYFFDIYAISKISSLNQDEKLQKMRAIEQIEVLIQQHENVMDEMGKDMGLMMDLYIESIHNLELNKVFNNQYRLILSIVEGLIQKAKNEGDINPSVDSSMLSAALLALFDGFGMAHQILDVKRDNYQKMALDAARLILKGARN